MKSYKMIELMDGKIVWNEMGGEIKEWVNGWIEE